MDAPASAAADNGRAIEFTGTLREFIPIAASNAALTIVTLFVYRSWAKARERRYLWSRTRFIDDQLQWTGSGLEMFIGFVIIALLLGLVGLLFALGLPAIAVRVGPGWMFAAVLALYIGVSFSLGSPGSGPFGTDCRGHGGVEFAEEATTAGGTTPERRSDIISSPFYWAEFSTLGHRPNYGTSAGVRCRSAPTTFTPI